MLSLQGNIVIPFIYKRPLERVSFPSLLPPSPSILVTQILSPRGIAPIMGGHFKKASRDLEMVRVYGNFCITLQKNLFYLAPTPTQNCSSTWIRLSLSGFLFPTPFSSDPLRTLPQFHWAELTGSYVYPENSIGDLRSSISLKIFKFWSLP